VFPKRRERLAVVGIAFLCLTAGVALRLVDAPDKLSALAWIGLGATVAVGYILWRTGSREDASLRAAIENNHAVGGVACVLPLDPPAWGSLVLTSTAYVWEPNENARANGHETMRIEDPAHTTATFGTVPVGVRQWPAVTIARPGGGDFTAAMSAGSAERLRDLLDANPTALG
jgi:hypothetical protein